ncbi:MAG: flagellar protein [Lachnospira sp.]|nr:flagellar protein [Lachnospira sp.]
MNQIAQQFTSLESLNAGFSSYPVSNPAIREKADSFQDVLKSKQQEYESQQVIFSKHANQRLLNRNMNLTKEQLERLNSGVEQARAKHIKESLIMVDDMSFIVNVSNNTVVTAMNKEDEQNIFTNIDGAVIS